MSSESSSNRLISIDALRGIAALGVVLYHCVWQEPTSATGFFNQLVLPLQYIFIQGYAGVFLFFVISGFCIHLQWAKARAAGKDHQINFKAFWKRRWRRLYPPYLLALALYLGIAAYTGGVDLTHFLVYDVVMHLLMLHNLDPHTCYSINGVFWTLAIEEQLYLAYFLLLFLRRRYGWTTTLAVCLLARLGWFFFSYFAYRLFKLGIPVPEAAASHWFTWALGALSVEAVFGLVKLPDWCRSLRAGALALGCAVGLSYLLPVIEGNKLAHDLGWLVLHPVWGLGFFILINHIVGAEAVWRERLKTPVLISWMAYIGIFSYSLYLTHQLVILFSWRFIYDEWSQMANTILVITPVSLAFAWVFYWFCERPFMKPAPAKVLTAAAAATLTTAAAPTLTADSIPAQETA